MRRSSLLQYLVSGTDEYGSCNTQRGTASDVLKKAKKLLREGFMDVKICTPTGRVFSSDELDQLTANTKETNMGKGQQRSNREPKKPKKKKIKAIAAAPSRTGGDWQPSFASGKKK